MKTNYIKCSLWLMVVVFAAMSAKAQTSVSGKTAYNAREYISYDGIRSENGKQVERIQSNMDEKVYKMALVNGKMTELYVDGVKIPAGDWDKYSDAIAAIKEQIRKNKEQATRNEEQARLNQIQDKKNEEQAKLNQIRDKKNEEQAVLNNEQAQRNEIQEKKNEEQAVHNEEQAQLNQLQEKKNEEQAARNREQARLNEIQAKKNQEQAEENARFMKQLIGDLVSDKIIPDEKSLLDFTIDSDGMSVNGVKQPDAVFKKYIGKYPRFEHDSMSFHDN